jgi:hypothetical protein
LLASLASLAPSPAARADLTPEQETALTNEAESLSFAGDFAKALPLYARLFAETKTPVYLRNVARCHQFLRHPDQAIFFFRRYLSMLSAPSPAERTEIEGYIAEMEALKRQEQPRPSSARSPDTSAPRAEPVQIPPPAETVSASPGTGASGRPWLRIAGWSAAGTGTLALATGLYFGVRAQSLESEVAKARQFSADDDDAGKTARTLQYVGYGLGAALVATGVTLLVIDRRRSELSVIPVVGAGHAGLTMRSRF